MDNISNIFKFNQVMNLEKGNMEVGKPSIGKITPTHKRVTRALLENQYMTNPITFNAINDAMHTTYIVVIQYKPPIIVQLPSIVWVNHINHATIVTS